MADKKLFELVLGTPLTSDKLAYGKVGSAYKNITYGDFKDLIIAAIPPAPAAFLQKVVNITNYDMEGGARYKEVNLGVVRNKIRSCTVLILSNLGGLYPLSMPADNEETKSYWFIMQDAGYAANARLKISSHTDSYFDDSAFNGYGTGGLRGYIFVTYVA